MRIPRALPPGGTIGICAPAGPVKPERMQSAIAALENEGYRVVLTPSALQRDGLFSTTDAIRQQELENLFARNDIDAVFCTRGGVGSSRLLERLKVDRIIASGKPFLGFSDVTVLQWWLAKCGLVSFQGPLAVEWDGSVSENSRQCALRTLSGERAENLFEGFSLNGVEILRAGKAVGPIMSGNLTMISTMLGTPYLPDLKGAILVLEDVMEPAYRIDRLLFQLRNAGVLSRIGALLTGELSCDKSAEERDNLRRAVLDSTRDFDFPVMMNLPFGHGAERMTLPVGAVAEIDTSERTLCSREPLVRRI